MEAREALKVLSEILHARPAHFTGRERFGVALEDGSRFILDPTSGRPFVEGWGEVDVAIYTNEETLADLADGSFDMEDPEPHHVFLVSGDTAALEKLGRAVGLARSTVTIRSEGL